MIRRTLLALAVLWGIGLPALAEGEYAVGDDALPIVEQALASADLNEELVRQYAFHERIEERYFGRKDREKKRKVRTWDVTLLDGTPYKVLIAKDDQPLDEEEQAEQQRKLEKQVAKLRRESPREREKRRAKLEQERDEAMEFLTEVTRAFDFRLAGEEDVDGLRAWVITAEPRADYDPPNGKAKVLKKVRGTIWIAQADHAWVRADLETIENFTWRLVFKLREGAEMRFTQQRVNGEVWMPREWYVRMRGRAALVIGFNGEFSGRYDSFRKFTTESRATYADATGPEGSAVADPRRVD